MSYTFCLICGKEQDSLIYSLCQGCYNTKWKKVCVLCGKHSMNRCIYCKLHNFYVNNNIEEIIQKRNTYLKDIDDKEHCVMWYNRYAKGWFGCCAFCKEKIEETNILCMGCNAYKESEEFIRELNENEKENAGQNVNAFILPYW